MDSGAAGLDDWDPFFDECRTNGTTLSFVLSLDHPCFELAVHVVEFDMPVFDYARTR